VTYTTLGTQVGDQRLGMVVNSVAGGLFADQGGEAGVVSPYQHPGLGNVLGQEVGVAKPAPVQVPMARPPSPWTATMLRGYLVNTNQP
jgi:DNA-directed RNA polymerase